MNFWQKDLRSCCKYNIENVSNYFLVKAEMCHWKVKSLNVKLINYKKYGNCIWIKRIKTGKNCAEIIIAVPENVSTSSTVELPSCQYNKNSIKTRSLLTTFSHQLKTMYRYVN